jgi:molybdopterin-guanine dinucleotide biosynthesis protein A
MSASIHGLPLGGVLVGGRSSRFGSDKAMARVGNRSMAARAVDTLRPVADPVVLLGGDGMLGRRLALPWRADGRPGLGPLSGLATGLCWAGELGRPGLMVLACDLPLVTREVMEAVAAAVRPDLDAVVVGAEEPVGVQPLCAWYAIRALGAVEEALDNGRHSARALLEGLRVQRIQVEDVGRGEAVALLNVNTPRDHAEAMRHATAEASR